MLDVLNLDSFGFASERFDYVKGHRILWRTMPEGNNRNGFSSGTKNSFINIIHREDFGGYMGNPIEAQWVKPRQDYYGVEYLYGKTDRRLLTSNINSTPTVSELVEHIKSHVMKFGFAYNANLFL